MPADHLKRPAPEAVPPAARLTDAVRSVLAGQPVTTVAERHALRTDELADAVDIYDRAGQAALYDSSADATWWQANLEFDDWNRAEETVVADLAPVLDHLAQKELLHGWWFIRKAPCWRLRLHPGDSDELQAHASAQLDRLVERKRIGSWRPSYYEPEALAFGGPAGIRIAHSLFSADSANLMAHLRTGQMPLGRRELSMLLCTELFRAAGQEPFEAADIWSRVAHLRSPGAETQTQPGLVQQLRAVLSYDTSPDGPLFTSAGTLASGHDWAAAFHDSGRHLTRAANEGNLDRGVRRILAHHVIFHWNRLGLDVHTQHALARAAATALLDGTTLDEDA